MYEQVEKPKKNKSRAVADSVAQKKSNGKQGFGFVDNRPEAVAQRKLQEMVINSPQVIQPVLKINRSQNLPYTELKYKNFKALTKKNKETGEKRYELSIPAWLNLKKMATSETMWLYDTWGEAIEHADQLKTKEDFEEEISYHESGVSQVEPTLHKKLTNIPTFRNFDLTQVWRLMLDGKHQEERGKYGFENEKGYMSAMMKAFTHMVNTLGEELTTDTYEQLHDLAVGRVLDRSGDKMDAGFRDSSLYGEGFGVDEETMTPEGFSELKGKYARRNDGDNASDVGAVLFEDPEDMLGGEVEQKIMRLKPLMRSQCIRFGSNVLNLYNKEIKAAESNDQKLTAIVKCCQDLDQLHLFVDGNIRTIAFLVLNKLLLENNMDPVILNEPNVFDCNSVEQLKAAVLKGQEEFNKYKS